MRTSSLSVLALLCPFACVVACSSMSVDSMPSGAKPPSYSGPAAASSGRSVTLVGDGQSLRIDGAPLDPSYRATYPVTGLTSLTVTVGAFGDLTAACASSAGPVDCDCLPFFSQIDSSGVNVYDAYGKCVIHTPPACNDAGAPTEDAGPIIPPVPPVVDDAGGFDAGGAVSIDAGSCAPTVVETFSSCTVTVGGITCDCSDATCAGNAIEACLASLGVPTGSGSSGGFDAGSDDGGGYHHHHYDAGVVSTGDDGGSAGDDAGSTGDDGGDADTTGGSCSAGEVASVQTQFCADVNAALAAHGITLTLDCSSLGTLTFPTSHPNVATDLSCNDLTHHAFAKVRAELAVCSPMQYVEWKFSATLQLFEAGVCTIW